MHFTPQARALLKRNDAPFRFLFSSKYQPFCRWFDSRMACNLNSGGFNILKPKSDDFFVTFEFQRLCVLDLTVLKNTVNLLSQF